MNQIHLGPDDGAGAGGDAAAAAAAAAAASPGAAPDIAAAGEGAGATEYKFAKIKEGDKEVDVPEAFTKPVVEFAKQHKLTPEQAQALLNDRLANKPADIPETYTFAKVKNEKNEDVDVPKEFSEPIAALAKELKLTGPQAQALLDREIKLTDEASKALIDQDNEMRTKWREDARKDPVLSKGNYDQNLGIARKALKAFFPGLDSTVTQHAFLDHPEILRGLYQIGAKISDDPSFVAGAAGVGEKVSLYPNSNMQK